MFLHSVTLKSTGVGVLLLGAVAGGLGSLVGLGGAFIIIPALTGPVGLSPHYAIGTRCVSTVVCIYYLLFVVGLGCSFLSFFHPDCIILMCW